MVSFLAGPVTEFLHDRSGFGSIPGNVGMITRQLFHQFGGHSPDPLGGRQQRSADVALALGQGIDERAPIQRQSHRSPQLRIVEWGRGPIDNDVTLNVRWHQLADRLGRLSRDILQHRNLKEKR
jgi:hypothetical protein